MLGFFLGSNKLSSQTVLCGLYLKDFLFLGIHMIVSGLEQFVIEAQQKDNALYLVLQRGVSNFKVS